MKPGDLSAATARRRVTTAWFWIGLTATVARLGFRKIAGLPITPIGAAYIEWVWIVWAILEGFMAAYAWRIASSRYRIWRLVAAFFVTWVMFEVINVPVWFAVRSALMQKPPALRDALLICVTTDVIGLVGYAIMTIATVTAALVAASYRRTADAELAAADMSMRVSRARVNRLRGQVRPDILSNWVTGIDSLMTRDSGRAESALLTLADFLRLTLLRVRTDVWPLAVELDYVRHHASLVGDLTGRRFEITRNGAPAAACRSGSLLAVIESMTDHANRSAHVIIDDHSIVVDVRPALQDAEIAPLNGLLLELCDFPAKITGSGIALTIP